MGAGGEEKKKHHAGPGRMLDGILDSVPEGGWTKLGEGQGEEHLTIAAGHCPQGSHGVQTHLPQSSFKSPKSPRKKAHQYHMGGDHQTPGEPQSRSATAPRG